MAKTMRLGSFFAFDPAFAGGVVNGLMIGPSLSCVLATITDPNNNSSPLSSGVKSSYVPRVAPSWAPGFPVAQIVMDYLAYGWSADGIHRQHPHLTLAEVHADMGYFCDNQAEIDPEFAAELEEVDRALEAKARSPVWLKLKV
jgi:hypothetical protein